jgi:hypothetical protein
MSGWQEGLITLVCVSAGALAGYRLQAALPGHHLSEDSKDVMKLVTGLVATLSALVLGLLIASAKSSFDTVSTQLKQHAASVLYVDRLLERYGPEADTARKHLKTAYEARLALLFPDRRRGMDAARAMQAGSSLEDVEGEIDGLEATSDRQRAILAQIHTVTGEVARARWLAFEETGNRTPQALIVILVSWFTTMFVGFGLFAPRNRTAASALLLGALAIASAVFLIEELSRPLDGWIAVSREPMLRTLEILGQ